MRSLKSGLVTILVAGFAGLAAVVGCSADGASVEPTTEPEGTDPNVQLPSSSSGGASDAGKKDSGKKDGSTAKDAGPPPPNPGDKCPKVDDIFKKPCGKCGYAEAVCLSTGAEGAGGTVSDYGACGNETGQCAPNETQACGNCGTQTCSAFCGWNSCKEPPGACKPGAVEYSTAGCPANTYRNRTCSATCGWSNFTTVCAEPDNPNKVIAVGSVGGVATGDFSLTTGQMGKRSPTYTCPTTSLGTGTSYPYEIVEIRNPTAQTAKVSVWLSGAPSIDTTMSAYATNLPPSTDAEIGACVKANDQCSTPCSSPWSGFTGTNVLTLGPNKAVVVRVSSYFTYDATDPAESTGAFTVNVRTEELN